MREQKSKEPEKNKVFWENGYVFLLGKNFGWTPGEIFLEYEACGGVNSQRCEDNLFQGKPKPTGKLRLELISKYSWSDQLIGIRMPKHLPDDLSLSVENSKFWMRPANSHSTVSSLPVQLNRSAPHVMSVKTDSGFDLGGLQLNSHWIEWDDLKSLNHKIYWVNSQKLTHGAGLIRINCPGCPKGVRVSSARLISPGDNIYIYGQGFGVRPGDIFLTYDNPTAPGATLRNLNRSIPIESGGADWWRNDRIHIKIKSSTPPPNSAKRPYLVIIDQNGRWLSGKYDLAFTPEMAQKVVSGEAWLTLGTGEGNTQIVSPDGSSMIVTHPTGGCSLINTREKGIDRFFYKGSPHHKIRVIRAEIGQIDSGLSAGETFKYLGKLYTEECAERGLYCLLTVPVKMVAKNIFHSLFGGDHGAYYIRPDMYDWRDSTDPRLDIQWENTCLGPYGDKPIRYFTQFILSGPKYLLYPDKQ